MGEKDGQKIFNQIVVFCQIRYFLVSKSQFEITTEYRRRGLLKEKELRTVVESMGRD